MMVTITKLPQMVRHGPVEIAVAVLPAAVTGAAIHGSSARPAAAGSRPTTGATLSVFGLRGHFPLEFWDHPAEPAYRRIVLHGRVRGAAAPAADVTPIARNRLSPEVLKSIRRKFGVTHRVLDVLVAEPSL